MNLNLLEEFFMEILSSPSKNQNFEELGDKASSLMERIAHELREATPEERKLFMDKAAKLQTAFSGQLEKISEQTGMTIDELKSAGRADDLAKFQERLSETVKNIIEEEPPKEE